MWGMPSASASMKSNPIRPVAPVASIIFRDIASIRTWAPTSTHVLGPVSLDTARGVPAKPAMRRPFQASAVHGRTPGDRALDVDRGLCRIPVPSEQAAKGRLEAAFTRLHGRERGRKFGFVGAFDDARSGPAEGMLEKHRIARRGSKGACVFQGFDRPAVRYRDAERAGERHRVRLEDELVERLGRGQRLRQHMAGPFADAARIRPVEHGAQQCQRCSSAGMIMRVRVVRTVLSRIRAMRQPDLVRGKATRWSHDAV
jgi:hypothetical protein